MALMCKAKENISLWNVICVYIKMPGSISINLKQEIINRIPGSISYFFGNVNQE